ncbi:hypothetical protein RJ641_007673 [Dillenia turbinata]|uniref:Transmembrane protein n=1 Tax=Dillenia turbinata TaxID=194707 RepID=A0AAN8V6Q0_9MAGN
MVKLATARDSRGYGPRQGRNRAEYVSAGLYIFATIVLLGGFMSQLSREAKSGLVLLLIASTIIAFVNIHDLLAHLAGIDFQLPLMELDTQLALVEFAVPILQAAGSALFFIGILFLFLESNSYIKNFFCTSGTQTMNCRKREKLEKHAMNMLVAALVLWVLGSIHNSCQIYQRADGHVQILQQSVYIPFLMGSLLFMVGSILNTRKQSRVSRLGLHLLGFTWIWMGIFGCFLFFIGGLVNVAKVFKMQQVDDGLHLEKLRGGAQEQLFQAREGQLPFILEDQRRKIVEQKEPVPTVPLIAPTPYKDVLVGGSSV